MKTTKQLFNEIVSQKNINADVVKSVSGEYYRLLIDDEPIIADSACEDLYDEESAYAMFYDYINEYM